MTRQASAARASALEPPRDLEGWDGRQLHELRRARGLTLKELSLASGLSIGLLSQLERGKSAPTIRTLQAVSRALKIPPSWFFQPRGEAADPEQSIIVRRGRGRLMAFSDDFRKELVTPDLSGALEGLLVTIAPGGSSGPRPYDHPGEEMGFVLTGEMELWVEEQRFHLKAGDSFRFRSERPHRFANPGRKAAQVLWVVTPPFY
ncbi:MAG: helix-turn-helix domain-containing protein [Alphaproteobacteria bacterium]